MAPFFTIKYPDFFTDYKCWYTLSLSWSSFSSGVSYSLVSFTFQRFHRTFNELSQIFLQTGARLGSDIAVTNVNVARFFTFSELLSLNAWGLGPYAEKFLFLYWKDDTRCVEMHLIKISFCSARPEPQWVRPKRNTKFGLPTNHHTTTKNF